MPPLHPRIKKIDDTELKDLKFRVELATGLIIFLMSLLVVRLWFLQIHKGEEFRRRAENNRVRIQWSAAPRGNLYDRNNEPIITNRPQFNVVLNKEDAPNIDETIRKTSKILHEDITTLVERMRKSAENGRHMPVRLKEDLDWKTLVYIENHRLDLPGIRIEVLPTREYLHQDMASHLIGYLGEISKEELGARDKAALDTGQERKYQPGDPTGKMGIEKLYEGFLRGEKGQRSVEVDVQGFEQRQLNLLEPSPGSDLYLTLDLGMQKAAEEAMADKAGSVVAIEVNTGKILTMTSSPQLRLKEFIGGISTTSWQAMLTDIMTPLVNKTIQGQYPPGSTYKIVTALAGLSEGVITPDTAFHCGGSLFYGNRLYGCWKKGGHGTVSLHRAIAESCDVYFYQVGRKVGVDNLAKYANGLGLGKKTQILLEHEKSGLIPTDAWKRQRYKEPWQEGETLSIAIGQGFDLVTPLQLTRMMAAVVNGGILYRPQYVAAIKDTTGNIQNEFQPIEDGKILGSTSSLELIKSGLVGVVNEPGGTGGRARLKEYKVGGKTGTAQVVKLVQYKGFSPDAIPYKYRDHAWFTCFAPAEKPEVAVTVLVEHGGHGGSAAAPIAQQVLKAYFHIKPEEPKAPKDAKPTTPEPAPLSD